MGYIAQQYAKLLDEEDILKLFGKLEEAAVKCDLTEDWKTLKGDMKTSTKEKVLEQLLEYLPLETMDYLTRKLFDSSSSLFMAYLTTLYERALVTNDRSQFLELANSFEQARDKYFSLISKKNGREIDDLTVILRKHSKRIGSTWKGSSMNSSKDQTLDLKPPTISDTSQQIGVIAREGLFPYLYSAATSLSAASSELIAPAASTTRKSPDE